jgi:hypothetical protein
MVGFSKRALVRESQQLLQLDRLDINDTRQAILQLSAPTNQRHLINPFTDCLLTACSLQAAGDLCSSSSVFGHHLGSFPTTRL